MFKMAATGNKQMHIDLKIEMVSHVIKNDFIWVYYIY